MDARTLVGMTQGARKRALMGELDQIAEHVVAANGSASDVNRLLRPRYEFWRIGHRLRPCPGCTKCLRCLCGNSAACIGLYEAWTKHQKAEPACNDCCGHGCEDGHCDKVEDICDGSGVIPAKARKVRR